MIDTKYYTITDYSSLVKVSRQTIYDWIESKKLVKDKDYIILSNGSYVILLNAKTKKLKALKL